MIQGAVDLKEQNDSNHLIRNTYYYVPILQCYHLKKTKKKQPELHSFTPRSDALSSLVSFPHHRVKAPPHFPSLYVCYWPMAMEEGGPFRHFVHCHVSVLNELHFHLTSFIITSILTSISYHFMLVSHSSTQQM